MNDTLYYILGGIAIIGFLVDIIMMSRVRLARVGNLVGAASVLLITLATMVHLNIMSSASIWIALVISIIVSLIFAFKVKSIQMPQVVALLNGFGGLASALVAWSALGTASSFEHYTALIALAIGTLTFTGSVVAAGKLARLFNQRPVVIPYHAVVAYMLLIATLVGIVLSCPWLVLIASAIFGVIFSIRVGGADMPITISLLNSLSGVAGGISGIAICNPVLVCAGGVVGASGLLLTQIMCRAMNRKLAAILLPSGNMVAPATNNPQVTKAEPPAEKKKRDEHDIAQALTTAKDVIIVPGYGMALAQAQTAVKRLADRFEARGAKVRYAIHPVAGRMPGHMNVLLCEVDVPYEQLFELESINDDFKNCDVAIAIGANDTINPAANTAEGTPIYGMPVLAVGDAKTVVICNLDTKPGYAGVPNAIYDREDVTVLLGDANESIEKILKVLE